MASSVHEQRLPALPLEGGGRLEAPVISYRSLGTLNAEGTNAVLVLHGYTTGPDMLEPGASAAEGSWSELVGPGKPIDSDRYFVVCPNMLGSCYGSTGPRSVNEATGRRWGLDFPALTMADIVRSQKSLLEAVGVKRLAAVAGPSFGGYQALQWGVQYPDMMERIVVAVSAPWHPEGGGNSEDVRAQLAAMEGWHGGQYDRAAMLPGLRALRIATLQRYGVEAELAPHLPDPAERTAAIMNMATDWAEGFDPGSLLVLIQAAERFDLHGQLGQLKAPLLWVLSRSDAVFPPALIAAAGPLLDAAGVDWRAQVLGSDKGHFASGADAHLWAPSLRAFMNELTTCAS